MEEEVLLEFPVEDLFNSLANIQSYQVACIVGLGLIAGLLLMTVLWWKL